MREFNIHFFKGIEPDELEAFSNVVAEASSGDVITMDFCNGGGSVFHGIAICDMMNTARERGIKFISNVWGYAASAACLVALSADEVYMSENSAIMYHSAWSASGNVDQGILIANRAQQTLLSTRISKISEKDFKGDGHWVTAPEARELGIIDNIIGNSASDDDSKDIRVAAQFIYGGRKMAEILKAESAQELEEKKDVEQEAKADCPEEEQKGAEHEEELKAADVDDVLEVLVQRLEGIEHRLAVLEGEGKKLDDEEAPSASLRRAALLAKLNAVVAPVAPVADKIVASEPTADETTARCHAVYKDFNAMMKSFIKAK